VLNKLPEAIEASGAGECLREGSLAEHPEVLAAARAKKRALLVAFVAIVALAAIVAFTISTVGRALG
jgi:hypothetical protein